MTKTIIIAGSSLGVGHTKAAHNLTEAILQTQCGWQVQVLDLFDFLPKSVSTVTQKSWRLASTNVTGLYSRFYSNSVNHPVAQMAVGMLARSVTKRIVQSLYKPPDVFVATHSFAVPVGSRLKELFDCKLCVVTTDFVLHQMHVFPNVDFLCVPPAYQCNADVDELSDRGAVIDTGIPIATEFANHKDTKELKGKFDLSHDLATVLFSFGGSGLGADKHVGLFSKLLEADLPIQFLVLAGQNRRFANAIRQRYSTDKLKDRIKVYDFVDTVSEFYAVADIFVGKAGGLSISEALATGLPMIIIDLLPGQEEFNLKVLSSAGAASYVPNVSQLKAHIEPLIDKVCSSGKTLHDLARPLSSSTVAKRVVSLAI